MRMCLAANRPKVRRRNPQGHDEEEEDQRQEEDVEEVSLRSQGSRVGFPDAGMDGAGFRRPARRRLARWAIYGALIAEALAEERARKDSLGAVVLCW